MHSPERAIAVVTRGGAEPGTRFFHVDHLGSIDVLTKEDGSIDERRSYDAYGARRNPEWGKPSGAVTSKTTRGYTGHEEDDDLGLVNAKGRMFDPRLARFTTTDPVIADIWDGQSLNRYAYVNGNPLAFTDPTGFAPEETKYFESSQILGEETKVGSTITVGPTVVVLKRVDSVESGAVAVPNHAANVGAYMPPVDVNTTGNGGDGLPQETPPAEPQRPGFLDGLGDGFGDFVDNGWSLLPLTPSWVEAKWETGQAIGEVLKKGDVIDAINVLNPLMPLASLAFAVDDDDWYTVGAATVGVGVAILSIVVGRKATGLRKGPKTTRGPPNQVSTLAPGPFAKESIPGHRGRPTAAEQRQVNKLMENHGCHTCGTKNSGTPRGNAIADHQPPQRLAEPEIFLPHCDHCRARQGGEVVRELRARMGK